MADATKYVSPQGSNSNTGNGPGSGEAYLTVTYALAAVSGTNNVIWIAPGVYEEATLALPSDGGAGALNILKGDPNITKAWGSSVHPGPVVLSHASSGVPQTGNCIDNGTYDYWELWDLWFDGVDPNAAATNVVVDGNAADTHNTLRRCVVVGGSYGTNLWNAEDCFICSSYYGAVANAATPPSFTIKRCICIGGQQAVSNINLDNCICMGGTNVIGSNSTTAYTVAKNSLALSGNFGLYYLAADSDNNMVLGANYGMRGGTISDGTILASCRYDTHATDGPADLSTVRDIYTYAATNATTPPAAGHTFRFRDARSLIRMVAGAFRPVSWNDEDQADGSGATSETYDMVGVPWGVRWRGESSNKKKIGPWSLPDEELQYDATKKNIIKLYRTSYEVLFIPIKKSTAMSISLNCDWSIDSGSTYPQIELIADGYSIASSTDTITGGDSQGHTLTVSVTNSEITDKDVIARLILKSRETTTSSYASFYGLVIA